jgi:hypothetical protein
VQRRKRLTVSNRSLNPQPKDCWREWEATGQCGNTQLFTTLNVYKESEWTQAEKARIGEAKVETSRTGQSASYKKKRDAKDLQLVQRLVEETADFGPWYERALLNSCRAWRKKVVCFTPPFPIPKYRAHAGGSRFRREHGS